MPTLIINKDKAVESLEAAAKKRGASFVAEVCRYARRIDINDPNKLDCYCLVGTALHHFGVPLEVLQEMDTYDTEYERRADIEEIHCVGDTSINAPHAIRVLAKHGFSMSQEAMEIFTRAQVMQDTGHNWGDAVSHAIGDLW